MKRKGYGYVGLEGIRERTKQDSKIERCPPASLFEPSKTSWFGLRSGLGASEEKFLEHQKQTASSVAKVFHQYCQRVSSIVKSLGSSSSSSLNLRNKDALLKQSHRFNQNIIAWFDADNRKDEDEIRREALIYWIQVKLRDLVKTGRYNVDEWLCHLSIFNYMLESYLDPKELHRVIPSVTTPEILWDWAEVESQLRSKFPICGLCCPKSW